MTFVMAYLKKVPIFAEFKQTDLQKLQKIVHLQRFPKGTIIFNEYASGNTLYVVVSGRVKIYKASGKKKKTLAFLEKGEFFGEMSLLDTEPRSASSNAEVDSELLLLKKQDFKDLLSKYPNLSFTVMQTLSKRLRIADKEIELLSFENVLGRIAGTLLSLCEKYGENTSKGCKINIPFSHKEFGEIAGTGREMVSRTLNRFKRLNCVDYDGRHIVVINKEKLREFIY